MEDKNCLKSEINKTICSASVASKQADSEANVLVEKVKKKWFMILSDLYIK